MVDLVQIDKKSNKIENIVNKYDIKTQISSATKHSASLPVSAF